MSISHFNLRYYVVAASMVAVGKGECRVAMGRCSYWYLLESLWLARNELGVNLIIIIISSAHDCGAFELGCI